MEPTVSGVGVIDKAMAIIEAVEAEPLALAGLVTATGQSRATAHRLALALEVHGMLRRDDDGRFTIGYRALSLARGVGASLPLIDAARPVLARLRDDTGESVQLFVRDGESRVCVASLESPHGLRTIVPNGAVLPLDQGSGGRVLRGETEPDVGFVVSVAEREAGVASVSAPVVVDGRVVAAVSVSGPIERMTTDPGARFGGRLAAAASAIG
jgi:DNA-binding IclR family transcriptional regulator